MGIVVLVAREHVFGMVPGVQLEDEFVNAVPATGRDFARLVWVSLVTVATVVVVIVEVLKCSAVVSVTVDVKSALP